MSELRDTHRSKSFTKSKSKFPKKYFPKMMWDFSGINSSDLGYSKSRIKGLGLPKITNPKLYELTTLNNELNVKG